jgi:predicted DNA-binding protein (MmcQ/YjbR family)
MDIEWIRRHCLSYPHTTEEVLWDHLVLKVAGKMFAMAALEPGDHWLSFKCAPEEYAELVELPGVVPARYLARAGWISLESEDALAPAEIRRLLGRAYELVFAKLPRKTRAALEGRRSG